jgi:hypothetical protein
MKILTSLFTLVITSYVASSIAANAQSKAAITQGPATQTIAKLFECSGNGSRVSAVGEIKDDSGHIWTVPAETLYQTAPKAFDLYNNCTKVEPRNITEVDLDSVPVVEVDANGEVVIAYIFPDNYFEMYVNGKLIAVDAIPFTPFNSSVVKFKVEKPYTVSFKLVDWEENLGLGSEDNRGKKYHPGDGGFIASFSDGTVTSRDWSAQTFYTAPINTLSCLKEKDGVRDTASCSTQSTDNGTKNYAAHWAVPENWMAEDFDASGWPKATAYTEDEIGVNNKKSYMNFIEKFSGAGAEFIWSKNVVLDNLVLLQYRVK